MIHKKKFKTIQTSNQRIYSIYHQKPLFTLIITLLLSTSINQQNIETPKRDLSDGSPVEIFTQYGDLSIASLDPNRGPTTGETRVMVRGKNSYAGLYQNYRTPACKFNGTIRNATFVECTKDTILINEWEKQERNWVCLQCENSPESMNSVSVNVTFEISITGDFNDYQVPNQNFKSTFEYYPAPEIYEIIPPYGQKDGTTNVTVIGKNFENYGNHTRCSFGENTTQAYFISTTRMYCISTFSHVVNRPMPFSVSLNNQQFSPSNISYWYYNWPQIAELIPPKGPWFGGTNVTLKGRNFKPFNDSEIDNTKDRYCLFDFQKNANPSNKYFEYQITRFQPLTKAYIESSTTAYCVSPEWVDQIETAWVELTLNNQEYTDDQRVFTYYMIPRLIDVNPREGPVPGGTKLTCVGENFKNDGNVTCKFTKRNATHSWTKIVPGRVQTSQEIVCESPPSDMPGYVDLQISLQTDVYSEPVKYLYYEMPVITGVSPMCGPDYGYTQITLFGKNFWDLGTNKALCVFNKTIFTNATIMHQDIIKCDSPTLYDSQGYSRMGPKDLMYYFIEVTIDGGRYIGGPAFKFNYYKDPTHLDIIPSCGPKRGGTLVRIAGQGLNHSCHCNKTVRFATWEIKPINESTDTSMYVYSPPVDVSDQVVVAVAPNGQQFTRDLIIHVRDDENTFEYYDDPIVTGYNPKAGPSIGGTRIKINGYGFTPRKNKDGEVDPNKNKMWIRFVDPNNPISELAPPSQVDPKDLHDDEAFWTTPPCAPGSKALMQVSLNGQDWTDVVPPKKTYSFEFYESPHIDVLHPAFGPVKAKVQNYVYIEGRNFVCPDSNCTLLKVRWMDPLGNYIYVRGEWLNITYVRCLIPKYPKPEELVVEITFNEQDYTNDRKKYGYFDPYVLNCEPRLISVQGTTKITIRGFGFVNSSATKSLFNSTENPLFCQLQNCIKSATFIDTQHLVSSTYPQTIVNYVNGTNILWDAMSVEAAVYENDFTENNLQIWYYDEPDYQGLSPDSTPANIETPIFIKTDFKTNPIDRLNKYANFTCRFKSEDGRVIYTKGQMVKYPLEFGKPANPNNVKCKSPIWLLKEKNQETVKLDIALNGQDFSGGFDFVFYEVLMLHRDLPMSGPLQGNSTTKLFGTGFKPRKGVVDIKWGVFATVEIIREQVDSCIYHGEVEYSADTCDDLLKTEIWDDTRFPTMYESKNYTTIYQQSRQVWNWTKTQGGPYFLEVGMNHSINYMKMLNQSIYEGNITVNGSSIAQYSYVTVPTIFSWVYFEYIYSTVYYWFYKDLVVKEIFPHSAKVQGGTMIQIAGAWFKDMPWHGVFPHCKFGNKVVRGFFDSTVRVACIAPPGNDIGDQLPIEVSLNGVDFSDTGFSFSYYSEPILDRITPTSGKESGGNPIFIVGKTNFTKMDNPNEFNCKFTPVSFTMPPKKVPAIYENSTFIRCQQSGGWGKGGIIRVQVTFNGQDYDENNFLYTIFSVYKVYPRSAPFDTNEEEEITIEGAGFISENMPACKMNGTVYNASYFTDTVIKCPILKLNSSKEGWVDFDVAPNGIDWSGFSDGFYFYQQPIVYSIAPPQGPAKGKGLVTFYGEGFTTRSNLQEPKCKIGNSQGVVVAQTDETMQCMFENIELTSQDEPLAAQVALNSHSWTYLNETTYYIPYGIEYFSPNSGPENGYIDVYVHGKGFETMSAQSLDGTYYASDPKCRFGSPDNNAIVDAQIVSYDKLLCRLQVDFQLLPQTKYPIDIPFAVALSSNESNSPWTETIHKFRLYDYPNLVTCEPSEVEIGTVTDVLLYADDTGGDFFDPVLVNNTGNLQNPIMCSFGRFGETEAVFINERVIKCRTPTIEDDPSSIYREEVLITVAMNGKDFDEYHSTVYFTFIGTGTYLVFWQILVVVMLLALIIAAIIVCISTLFSRLSRDDGAGREGLPYVFNIGGGLMVPRGRSDWNAERSSVDILEKASGGNF